MKRFILPILLLACFTSVYSQDLFFDGFEEGLNWTLIDADGDNLNWTQSTNPQQIRVASGNSCAYSQSWSQETSAALTPNNYMISPAITLPSDAANVVLEWQAFAQDQSYAAEHYEVIIATAATQEAVDAGTILYDDVVGANGEFQRYSASLASFAGQTIHIAFVHNEVTDQFMLNIDDVRVFSASNLDASLAALDVPSFALANSSLPIKVEVKNEGATAVTALELSYTIDGGSPVSQTFDGLNLGTGSTQTFEFSSAYALTDSDISLNANIVSVNGQADDVADNNSASKQVSVLSSLVNKTILIEEGTGTWCGFCPRGAVGLDSITSQYDNVIGIAVHSGDVMAIEGYDAALGFPGLPASTINRSVSADPAYEDLALAYNNLKDQIAPLSLSTQASYDASTKKVTVDITPELHVASLSGDYRINVILTEDGVTGTGDAYAQTNYYANNENGEMGGFENLPNPVPADQMVYNHVARLLMGGFDGDENSFPASLSADESYTYRYEGTIDDSWDVSNMHAVAIFIDRSNGEILNSQSVGISTTVSTDDIINNDLAAVSPNPFNQLTNITLNLEQAEELTLTVIDAMGREVSSTNYGQRSGKVNLTFDGSELPNGTYYFQLRAGKNIVNKKVILIK